MECQGRQLLPGAVGSFARAGYLSDGSRRGRDEVGARSTILDSLGIRRECTECGGADDPGARDGAHHPLGAVPFLPLLDQLHQSLVFEESKVVVEFLPGDAEPAGKSRGGIEMLEGPKDSKSSGIEQ